MVKVEKAAKFVNKKSTSRIRYTKGDWAVTLISYAVVTIFALTIIYPVLNIIAVSMSSYRSYQMTPWMFFPYDFDFGAFEMVFTSRLIMRSYLNTIIITVSGTILVLILTTLTAYPLSRAELRGKPFFMTYIIFTMIFNGGLIPNFLLVRALGMNDTLFALFIPGALSAFWIILMLNFFKGIPASLIEAARIDGAGEIKILLQIVLPLSTAILATIALFASVGYWNNFFNAVIYIRSQELWPVQLVLREIIMRANVAVLAADGNFAELDQVNLPTVSLRYAALIVTMLPIMCVYPFLQKYFVKGVMIGAVKG